MVMTRRIDWWMRRRSRFSALQMGGFGSRRVRSVLLHLGDVQDLSLSRLPLAGWSCCRV
jgi:hypothetical protein